jgi:pyruvate formate-lyase activating enzyme-like uncharacterized protein
MNLRCPSRCFFCIVGDPTACRDVSPYNDLAIFLGPDDHAACARLYGLKGVGFSGGEPLLDPQSVYDHIRALRAACGKELYLWLYTSGALLTEAIVDRLAALGLDEIRVNLAAIDYDLGPLERAGGRIPLLTVEIPAIPEDEQRFASLFAPMAARGVRHLHLHQLWATQGNVAAFHERGYRLLLNGPENAVHESEMSALRLLRAIAEDGIDLAAQYCAKAYKDAYQGTNDRVRKAGPHLASHQAMTGAGMIRTIRLRGETSALRRLAESWRTEEGEAVSCRLDPAGGALEAHPVLMEAAGEAAWSGPWEIEIDYLEIRTAGKVDEEELFSGENARLGETRTYAVREFTPPALEAWRRRFLQKEDADVVFADLRRRMEAEGFDALTLEREAGRLERVAMLEELPTDLPRVY